MRTVWRLLLARRLKSGAHDIHLYDWLQRFKQDGLTPTMRMELREILSPRVILREPFHWSWVKVGKVSSCNPIGQRP